MASDWEEVKRLAADFQRAQLTNTAQKLSERNCIEIVKKLIEKGLIDVVFTNDGKEYITSQHLLKEIEDELYIHQGRVSVVDLAQILNVDYNLVDNKSKELTLQQPDLTLILGDIISLDYLDRLGEEVNEKLQQTGRVSISDLTLQYDLPGDYLEQVIHQRLGSIIHGSADPYDSRVIFTDTFMAQNKARIRGVLNAITRPVALNHIINHYHFHEKLFQGIVTELIKENQVAGSLVGTKEHATYVPNIYAKLQNEWVESFFKQNGYLDFDSLKRLGISDPASFVARKFPPGDTLFLKSCCVGGPILSQVEAAVEDAIVANSWVDILPLLPSSLTPADMEQIIQTTLTIHPKQTVHIFCDTILVTEAFLLQCVAYLDPLINSRAEEALQKGEILQYFVALKNASSKSFSRNKEAEAPLPTDKKDDRRKKAAGGKLGGGTQGRETKTKAVKNKKRNSKTTEEQGEESFSKSFSAPELTFYTQEVLEEHLIKMEALKDAPEELVTDLLEKLYRTLKKKFLDVAENLYQSSLSVSGAKKKKQFGEFQENALTLHGHIHICEKGLKVLSDDLLAQLQKHLVKTHCSDLANLLLAYIAEDQGLLKPDTPLTNEVRQKILPKLGDEYKEPFTKLISTLNSKTSEDFLENVDSCLEVCGIIVKKVDKKKEKQILQNLRAQLNVQLDETTDPALALHLATLLVFQAQTHHVIHASGKFVPSLISFLHKQVPTETFQILHESQELVLKKLSQRDKPEEEDNVDERLQQLVPKIKQIVTNFKRKGSNSESHE